MVPARQRPLCCTRRSPSNTLRSISRVSSHPLSKETSERRRWMVGQYVKQSQTGKVSSVKQSQSDAYVQSMRMKRSYSVPLSTGMPRFCGGSGHRTWSARRARNTITPPRDFRCNIVHLFATCRPYCAEKGGFDLEDLFKHSLLTKKKDHGKRLRSIGADEKAGI